jgi:hypothetical protein
LGALCEVRGRGQAIDIKAECNVHAVEDRELLNILCRVLFFRPFHIEMEAESRFEMFAFAKAELRRVTEHRPFAHQHSNGQPQLILYSLALNGMEVGADTESVSASTMLKRDVTA